MESREDFDVKFDKILGQVRALIAKADSTQHKGEEDLLRAKAESLMLKYRIEEWKVHEQAIGTTSAITPVWSTMRVAEVGNEFGNYYNRIAGVVTRHAGVKCVIKYEWEGDHRYVVLHACGFSSDLRYAELLLTSCVMEFGKRLEPKIEDDLTDAQNALRLRQAGWERKRITAEMFGGWNTVNEMKAKNRKVTALIRKQAVVEGIDPNLLLGRGNMMSTYRDSYAEGFVQTIARRLTDMTRQAREMNPGALVPLSRAIEVEEAFYAQYPNMRPAEATEWKDPTSECEKCKRAKSGYCREHSYLKPRYGRPQAFNGRAYAAGRTAAYDVNLGPSGTQIGS